MFTLILLALGMAAIAASFLSTSTSPLTVEQALPAGVLALSWRRVGERNTRNGAKVLWRSETGDTSSFQRAYAADREAMRTVGFSWDDRTPVCWESVPAASDDEVLAVVAAAEAKADVIREQERVAKVQEADRDWLENGATRIEAIQSLRECLNGKPWAWTKRKREWAVAILEADRPPARAVKMAAELVAEVEGMIAVVTARLASERIQDWWERAGLPEVRVAVLEACCVLSSYDEDFAALRNGVGWSAAHSHTGHVVASMPELDQTQASHALRAVFAHRRQISPELRGRVFGSEAV